MGANNQLIEDNINLVYQTLKELNLPPCNDLISEGMLALTIAANKFDEKRGLKFSTYAVCTIKGYMKLYVSRGSLLIKPRLKDNKLIYDVSSVTSLDVCNTMASSENLEEEIVVLDFLNRLNSQERHIVDGLMQRKTQLEIGKELSISQSQVSSIIKKIRNKLRTYIS